MIGVIGPHKKKKNEKEEIKKKILKGKWEEFAMVNYDWTIGWDGQILV